MEKRLVFAIALSLIVMVGWSVIFKAPQRVVNKEVAQIAASSASVVSTASSAISTAQQDVPAIAVSSEKTIDQDFKHVRIAFIENLGAISAITFKQPPEYVFKMGAGFAVGDGTWQFVKENIAESAASFLHKDPVKSVTQTYYFDNTNNRIRLDVKIRNDSREVLRLQLPITLVLRGNFSGNTQGSYEDIVVATSEKTTHHSLRKALETPVLKFLSFRDQYFCAIIEPMSGSYKGYVKKIDNQTFQAGLISNELSIQPNEQIGQSYDIYLGPQDVKLLAAANSSWAGIVHYGSFDFISQILVQLLEFIFKIVHNWGVAVILLSILVYLALFPLSLKQMKSMKEMQILQPQVEKMRVMYKDNPQRMNKEVLELYKKHKVNPVGGCLPLILQMPIFFALYQALMRAANLRGAEFLWIKDLSSPDRLFTLPVTLPLIGNAFNLLPILMTVGMFIQQKITMATTASANAEQQKIMMVVFPLMFCFIFYNMPAALVLYWFVNSTLMLVFQMRMSRAK